MVRWAPSSSASSAASPASKTWPRNTNLTTESRKFLLTQMNAEKAQIHTDRSRLGRRPIAVCAFGAWLFFRVFFLPSPASGNHKVNANDWPVVGRDEGGTRYSPLRQIDRTNVARLRVAWEYH